MSMDNMVYKQTSTSGREDRKICNITGQVSQETIEVLSYILIIKDTFNSWHAGQFFIFVLSSADLFFKMNFFKTFFQK